MQENAALKTGSPSSRGFHPVEWGTCGEIRVRVRVGFGVRVRVGVRGAYS